MKLHENVSYFCQIQQLFNLNFGFLVLKYGFRKTAKKNDYIRVEDIGDAFRHSGQNPAEDTIKDMIDKANKLKASYHREDEGSYA
jgi:uncharacterized protein YneF (UPF0154 family)